MHSTAQAPEAGRLLDLVPHCDSGNDFLYFDISTNYILIDCTYSDLMIVDMTFSFR